MKKLLMVLVCCVFWASLAIAGDKVVYVVKKGDTLDQLMYVWQQRQGVEVKKLFIWNADLGTQVRVGQEIIYYLPDQREDKQLSKQEAKKIVAETIAQMEKSKAPVAPAKRTTGEQTLYLLSLSLGIAVVVILCCVLVFALWRTRRKATDKIQVIAGRQRKVLLTADPNAKEVEGFGYVTKVKCEQRGDMWVWELPFCNVRADQSLGERIWNESLRKLESSLARCYMPGSKFASQIPGLIEGGDIRKI